MAATEVRTDASDLCEARRALADVESALVNVRAHLERAEQGEALMPVVAAQLRHSAAIVECAANRITLAGASLAQRSTAALL